MLNVVCCMLYVRFHSINMKNSLILCSLWHVTAVQGFIFQSAESGKGRGAKSPALAAELRLFYSI